MSQVSFYEKLVDPTQTTINEDTVVILGTTVSAIRKTTDALNNLTLWFDNLKVKYVCIDCAQYPSYKQEMEKISQKKVLPQVFLGKTKFLGMYEEFADWVEEESLKENLQALGVKTQ